jgi:hypothetical protein
VTFVAKSTSSLGRLVQDFWIRALLGLAVIAALVLLALNQIDLRYIIGTLVVIGAAYLALLSRKTGAVYKSQQALVESTQTIAKMTVHALDLSNNVLTELRATREAQTTPYVVLYLDVSDNIVRLVMENLGQALAREITLAWEPMLPATLIGERAWAAFVTETTPMLAPRQKLVAVLDSYTALAARQALQGQFRVTVRFQGLNDSVQFQGIDVIDFASLAGMRDTAYHQGQAITARLDAIAQSLEGALRLLHQSNSQLSNQLGDLARSFETTIAATNTTQAHVLNSLEDIARAVNGTVSAANSTQSQVIGALEDITKAVAGTMETVNMTQDQLTQGMVALSVNRREGDKQSPEQAITIFKLLVKRLDMGWRKMQDWPAGEHSSPTVYLQRQMVQWARDIVAIAPTLPAAAVVTERAGNVALKLISALDDAGQVTPADAIARDIAELDEIAHTFPEEEESFLL